jgi:hypothetical protein
MQACLTMLLLDYNILAVSALPHDLISFLLRRLSTAVSAEVATKEGAERLDMLRTPFLDVLGLQGTMLLADPTLLKFVVARALVDSAMFDLGDTARMGPYLHSGSCGSNRSTIGTEIEAMLRNHLLFLRNIV